MFMKMLPQLVMNLVTKLLLESSAGGARRRARGCGGGGEEPTGDEPAGKRKKMLTYLDDDEEENMVKWLMDNPIIYNKKMRDYKDTSMKERLWEAKAAEIGKDKRELQTWYKRGPLFSKPHQTSLVPSSKIWRMRKCPPILALSSTRLLFGRQPGSDPVYLSPPVLVFHF